MGRKKKNPAYALREKKSRKGSKLVAPAAWAGNPEVVTWLVDHGWTWKPITCLGAAISGGHVAILRWAKEEGLLPPKQELRSLESEIWNKHSERKLEFSEGTEVLEWCKENGIPLSLFDKFGYLLSEEGHLDALKWLWEREKEKKNGDGSPEAGTEIFEGLVIAAVSGAHVEILRWIWEIFPELEVGDVSLCCGPAINGHLEVIQFLKGKVFMKDVFIATLAGRHGHFEIVRWFMKEGLSGVSKFCSQAAKYGDLEMLRWLREGGCPWDHKVFVTAGKAGHWNILEWARKEGCPWKDDVPADVIRGWQHVPHVIQFLEWVQKNGLEVDVPKAVKCAFFKESRETLEWFVQQDEGRKLEALVEQLSEMKYFFLQGR